MKRNPYIIEKLRDKFSKNKQFDRLKKLYEGEIPEVKNFNTGKLWDKLNNKLSQNNPMAKEKIEIVINLIPKGVIKVLDIGFGSGEFEKKVLNKKYNFQLHGIDLSSESVKKLSTICPGIFKIGKATNLKFPKLFFDCILALDILEHIQPSKIFITLSEIYRILKPKSFFILSVPLNENLQEINLKKKNYSAHVREYTENIIRAELKISSFKILKEKKLYAFNNMFCIKNIIIKILPFLRKPNLIIILAQKI